MCDFATRTIETTSISPTTFVTGYGSIKWGVGYGKKMINKKGNPNEYQT